MFQKHPKVSENLSSWAQQEYSRWLYWKENGNTPILNESIEDELYQTLYNKEFRKNALSFWTPKQYLEFRKKMLESTFKTVYFSEVIVWLNKWNALFKQRM